jgi:flagellar protein FlaJ
MMLVPLTAARKFSNKYLFLGQIVARLLFSLKYDLQKAELDIDVERYCLAALISATIYAVIFSVIAVIFGAVITNNLDAFLIILILLVGFMSFFGALMFHLMTPRLEAGRIATRVDQELIFALRNLLIQLSSGTSLFEAIRAISKSNYGQVSIEFGNVVKDIGSGMSETNALEKLAFRTKSDVLKKSIWHIITTIKSGGSVANSLNSQIEELVAQQSDAIRNYAAELNLWTLVYLIIAAAMPSLGVTFLVIASSISSGGIGKDSVLLIALLGAFVQVGLIFIIKQKVPKVIN